MPNSSGMISEAARERNWQFNLIIAAFVNQSRSTEHGFCFQRMSDFIVHRLTGFDYYYDYYCFLDIEL